MFIHLQGRSHKPRHDASRSHSLLDDYKGVRDPTSDLCIYYHASWVRCKLSSSQCAWRRACGFGGWGGHRFCLGLTVSLYVDRSQAPVFLGLLDAPCSLLLSDKGNMKEHSLDPLQPAPARSHDSAFGNWCPSVLLPLRGTEALPALPEAPV